MNSRARFSGEGGEIFFFKNDAKLSEIIVEINNLRRVACVPDRPEQDRRRY
jgi:hypothetical protein